MRKRDWLAILVEIIAISISLNFITLYIIRCMTHRRKDNEEKKILINGQEPSASKGSKEDST